MPERQQQFFGKPAGRSGVALVVDRMVGGLCRSLSKIPTLVRKLGGVPGVVLHVAILAAVGGFFFAGRDFFYRPWTIRERIGVGVHDQKIYVFGGVVPEVGVVRDVLAFDVSRGRVSRVGELPWPADITSIVEADAALYVMDGRSGATKIPEIVRLDPVNGSIAPVGHTPNTLSFGGLASDGSTIYYAGGWDGDEVRDEVLAFSPGSWDARTIAHLPMPVRNCAATCLSGRLYVLGGETEDGAVQSLLVEIDIASGDLLRTLELPAPISRTAIVAFEGYLYIFGGWNREALGGVARISIGPGPMIHRRIGQLPAPSSECTAVVAGQRIVVVGGEPVCGKRELRISEFDPAEGTFRVLRFRGSI